MSNTGAARAGIPARFHMSRSWGCTAGPGTRHHRPLSCFLTVRARGAGAAALLAICGEAGIQRLMIVRVDGVPRHPVARRIVLFEAAQRGSSLNERCRRLRIVGSRCGVVTCHVISGLYLHHVRKVVATSQAVQNLDKTSTSTLSVRVLVSSWTSLAWTSNRGQFWRQRT